MTIGLMLPHARSDAVPGTGHGRISARPACAALIALCLAVAATALCADVLQGEVGLVVAACGVVAALALSAGLREGCDLYWNAAGIEGPRSMFGWHPPQFIAWEAVTEVGCCGFGGGFVAGDDGSLIRWTAAHANAAALRADLARARPEIAVR